ncbi:mitochondrial DNA helicase-like [Penaeus indicus]|uniref:mitochondrial DNA helicase-like n=1 Tax=Penaeus indicus TaxID=29960 RepID=UPI00300C2F00
MWLFKIFQNKYDSPSHVLSFRKMCTLAHLLQYQGRSNSLAQFGASFYTSKNVTKVPQGHPLLRVNGLYQSRQQSLHNWHHLSRLCMPSLSQSLRGTPSLLLNIPHGILTRNTNATLQLDIHTSSKKRDIPEYLQGNISEVASLEDDLLLDELEEEEGNDMGEDIVDFLTSHLIAYEETATSFTVQCPACSKEDKSARPQEVFVDKNSGYFVCPWCCRAGSWEELMHLLNTTEDCLTAEELHAFLSTTLPVSEAEQINLQESPLKYISLSTLNKYDARVTSEGARIVVPVQTSDGEIVGFESVSTLHQHPLVIRRYVSGKASVFGASVTKQTHQRIIVVPSCCDVLKLAEHDVPAVSLPTGNVEALQEYISGSNKLEVILWLGSEAPPRTLLMALIEAGVSCSLIRSAKDDQPIHIKTSKEIQAALKNTIPVLSETTTTFAQLKDKIYYRLTHKEEVCGVQWKRYSELNELLLGHRPGELTVLTGPTGSGKTTFMAEYSLDLCMQGVKTLWGSFEVSVVRLCEVMLHQFSGTSLPHDPIAFNNLSSQFALLPLHFLTYHGQQTASSVIKAMTEAVRVWGIQHVVIDNLQFMLGTSDQSMDRWWEQDRAVAAFRRFATTHNCHVTLIVHPKKVPDGQLLSINSVFGGAKATQEADNVLILQVKSSSAINQSKKALQVVKNRYGGQLGVLPLRFHKESLTLSSCFRRKDKEKDKEKGAEAEETRKANSSAQRPRVKGLSAFGF